MPVRGGYLRTNYRTTGADLDVTAIGGGYPKGSVRGGSALEGRFWGGFVINSFSAINSVWQVQPLTDIIYSYWGGGYDSGYLIVPIGVQIRYIDCSGTGSAGPVGCWVSLSAGTDSTINIGVCIGGSLSGAASSCSGAFIVAGFIASAP